MMRPRPNDNDTRLWSIVTATVRPLRGRPKPRAVAKPFAAAEPATPVAAVKLALVAAPQPAPARARTPQPAHPPHTIEAGLHRRLARGRDPVAARIDLHGLNQDQARALLTDFVLRGWREHRRTLLIITGKGALGDGVLKRGVPEWLAEAPLRAVVAGLSEAHRRHGGEGALYVALKRADVA